MFPCLLQSREPSECCIPLMRVRLERQLILLCFVSYPDVNNEFSSADGNASVNVESGSSSALGGRGSGQGSSGEQTSEYDGGGQYEGAKGYGMAPVEKDEQAGQFGDSRQ